MQSHLGPGGTQGQAARCHLATESCPEAHSDAPQITGHPLIMLPLLVRRRRCYDPNIGGLNAKCDVYSFGVLLWELVTQVWEEALG